MIKRLCEYGISEELEAEKSRYHFGRQIPPDDLLSAKIQSLCPTITGNVCCSEAQFDTLRTQVQQTSSILPSVRCGLEMAILNAIAARQGSSLLNILCPHMESETEISGTSQSVQICALIDSNGTPSEVAHVASTLVKEGFNALKLKVARRPDPIQDAAVVQEVRREIGYGIVLRVDANRNWTYDEAIQFSLLVKNCDLQYIEEPVQNEDDVVKYCEESGLPVALDETIDRICKDPLEVLAKYTHPGIVSFVIKPSFVGGFENFALIAKWAQQMGKMAIASATFESGLGLSSYVVFSHFLELQNVAICKVMNYGFNPIAHGLGTYRWLTEDVTTNDLGIYRNPQSAHKSVLIFRGSCLKR